MTEPDFLSGLGHRFLGEEVEPDPVKWAKDVLGVHLWSKQREIMRLIEHTDRVAVPSTHGVGKAVPLSAPIATPSGWTTMGEIQVGDQVFDETGTPTTVTGKSPTWRMPCYTVTFDDGSSLTTNGPHEWNVTDAYYRRKGVADWRLHWDDSQIRTTEELMSLGVHSPGGQRRWRVPTCQPLDLPDVELPIDPYVFGVWLGDGTSVRPEVTCHPDDSEILDRCAAAGENVRRRPYAEYAWVLTGELDDRPLFLHRLRDLGVLGNKHIPMQYLRASRAQRLELLRGIMDTDGTTVSGKVAIDLCDERLAYGVAELVRSFGWKLNVRKAPAVLNGVEVGTRYRMSWRADVNLFHLSRKARAWTPPGMQASRSTLRTIVSIEPAETVETVCIEVDSPRHLFLAGESLIPTHNSFMAAVTTARFLSKHPPGTARVVTTAPTNDQVKAVLWNEIGQLHSRADGALPGRVTQNTWWIGNYLAGMGRKPSEYAAGTFQGIHAKHILVILDEADAIPKELWDGVEKLVTNAGKVLAIGNPYDPQSEFARVLNGARTPGEDGKFNKWHVVHIPASVTPNLTGEKVPDVVAKSLIQAEFVEDRRREWGEDSALWKGGIMAVHPDESEMTVVRLADVLASRRGFDGADAVPERRLRFEDVQLGVDIAASEKGDETVVYERRGNKICRRWAVRSGEPEDVADLIVLAQRQSGATLVHMDIGGVGWALPTELKRRMPGVAIRGFMAQATAEDPKQFVNRRSEGYWYLREALRHKAIDLSEMDNADTTTNQLTAARYKLDKGKIRVELKDDIRKRIGRSPDDSDALILAILPPDGATMPATATARAHTKERAVEEAIRAQGADAPKVNTTPRAVLPREVPASRYGVRSKRRSFTLRAQ